MSSQYWYNTPAVKTAVVIVVSLILPAIIALMVWALRSESSQKQSCSPPDKPKFWRIMGLPANITKSGLEQQLKQSFQKEAGEKGSENSKFELTLARYTSKSSCAIVTSFLRPRLEDSSLTILDDFGGITPIYTPEDASVDIVMVTGLGGHALGSLRSANGWNVWLRDFIPNDIKNARILVYGYDTKVVNSDNKSSIGDLAKGLLRTLEAFRSNTETKYQPLTFVGHSLGGLLIKEALAEANNSDSPGDKTLFTSTYGLVFLGVPNLGLRNGQLRAMVSGQPNQRLIDDLVVDKESEPSPYLSELTRKFIQICKKQEFKILSYYERKGSHTLQQSSDKIWTRTGPPSLLVTEESARRIGSEVNNNHYPLSTDHRDLVRFDHIHDENYQQIVHQLKQLSEDAVSVIRDRFRGDKELTHDQRMSWLGLNRPPYASFKNSDKLAKADKGTLEWVVNEDNTQVPLTKINPDALSRGSYCSWRDSANSECLLVTAPPGRGKSVLSNFVVENIHTQSSEEYKKGCKVIYYFCNIRNEE